MKIDTDFAMTINGQSVTTENTLPVYNPATRSVLAQVPDASKPQLDEAVSAARQAFGSWSQTPVEERQAALERFADLIEENAEGIMALLSGFLYRATFDPEQASPEHLSACFDALIRDAYSTERPIATRRGVELG